MARDLRRRRGRERTGLFVAEGVRTVEELLASPLRLRGALVTAALDRAPRGRELRAALERAAACHGAALETVDEPTFASAADTDSPQGVLAIAERPEHSFEKLPAAGPLRLVVLDAVQDPGNVGTILRTAAALGADGIVALPGTVDLWNPKVVRAAMGALFHRPAWHSTVDTLIDWTARTGVALWGAGPAGTPLPLAGSPPDRLALAVGNEGAGLSPAVARAAERTVAVPLAPGAESLNVAVATGILLHALGPAPAAS